MADNIAGIPFSSDDEGINFVERAKDLVFEVANHEITAVQKDEIYVVWFAFVLGNWKALISTSIPDGRIYEVTHNKAKGESYVDSYIKTHNVRVTD